MIIPNFSEIAHSLVDDWYATDESAGDLVVRVHLAIIEAVKVQIDVDATIARNIDPSLALQISSQKELV